MEQIYRISKKAIEDLEAIWLYTKKTWSVKQADRYYKLIIDEITYLAYNHDGGKSIEYVTDYKVSKVRHHLIFYKQLHDQSIEVIRILHEKMNIENRLKEE